MHGGIVIGIDSAMDQRFRAAMERALLARRPKLPPRRVRLSLCGFSERTKRGTVVSTNKCLAKSNKSRTGTKC
jgi:hypothetical protein